MNIVTLPVLVILAVLSISSPASSEPDSDAYGREASGEARIFKVEKTFFSRSKAKADTPTKAAKPDSADAPSNSKADKVAVAEGNRQRAHSKLCQQPLVVVGDQAGTIPAAKAAADKHWMAHVRWKYGEAHMEVDNATSASYVCSRSHLPMAGIGDALIAYRCELTARPCAASPAQR